MPSIPVGTQTAASAEKRVGFKCERCGCQAQADVVGIGEGVQSFLNAPGTAEERARKDAEKDIARTIDRAMCPNCKQRNPGAVWRFWMPYLLIAAGGMALGVFLGYAPTWFDMNMRERDRDICKWVVPLIFFVSLLLVVPLSALIKWGTTDGRVKWVKD
jgi:hypothetical protein